MEIIPAVDIRKGRCVRLYQGDFARETVFSDDPVAVAGRWEEQGAERLHLVDLDGARSGEPMNAAIIERVIKNVTIPCQVGGGIRNNDTVNRYIQAGAERVVLGTAAVSDQWLVRAACQAHPAKIVVAIDARGGKVATQGWLEMTGEKAETLMRKLVELGVPRFIYTDISRDGTLKGPNFSAIERAAKAVKEPVIASGGIAGVEHLQRLIDIGVEAAILGRAIYDGTLPLKTALQAVK